MSLGFRGFGPQVQGLGCAWDSPTLGVGSELHAKQVYRNGTVLLVVEKAFT